MGHHLAQPLGTSPVKPAKSEGAWAIIWQSLPRTSLVKLVESTNPAG